jgi:hypothetical protein
MQNYQVLYISDGRNSTASTPPQRSRTASDPDRDQHQAFSRHNIGLPIVSALPTGVAISRRILCTLQRSNAGSCPRRRG